MPTWTGRFLKTSGWLHTICKSDGKVLAMRETPGNSQQSSELPSIADFHHPSQGRIKNPHIVV
jgi:hypothetical protein